MEISVCTCVKGGVRQIGFETDRIRDMTIHSNPTRSLVTKADAIPTASNRLGTGIGFSCICMCSGEGVHDHNLGKSTNLNPFSGHSILYS